MILAISKIPASSESAVRGGWRNDFLAVELSWPADAIQKHSLITGKHTHENTRCLQAHTDPLWRCLLWDSVRHILMTQGKRKKQFCAVYYSIWNYNSMLIISKSATQSMPTQEHKIQWVHATCWLTICECKRYVQSPTGSLRCPQMAAVNICSCTSCE